MMRRIAVVGDMLSNGGEVCDYTGMMFTMGDAGHQVALIDGAAYCAVCKTTGYIAKDGGPRRMTLGMSEVALDQDFVVCGCPEHPRIFARLAGEAWYDDLAESLGVVGSRGFAGAGVAGSRRDGTEEDAVFDRHFQLVDQDGVPVGRALFYLQTPTGEIGEITTTPDGKTPIVEGQDGSSIKLLLAYR